MLQERLIATLHCRAFSKYRRRETLFGVFDELKRLRSELSD